MAPLNSFKITMLACILPPQLAQPTQMAKAFLIIRMV
jgi:hypothetical protein